MCRLLRLFCKIWGEPWYGENAGLVEGFLARPDDIELAGGALLPVPRPIAVEIEGVGPANLLDEPQCACRRQPKAQRVSPDDPWQLPTLLMTQPIKGIGVTNCDFDGPAVSILLQHVLHVEGEIRGEEGLDGGRRLVSAWRLAPLPRGAADRHDPYQPAGQHGVPQAHPRLHLRARFAGMGEPAVLLLQEGLGRPEQRPFPGSRATTRAGRRGGQGIQLPRDQKP